MNFRCDACGSERGRALFPATDQLWKKPGVFWIVRCRDCSLLHTRPVPKDLGAYYPHEYPAYRALPKLKQAPGWIRRIFDAAWFTLPDLPRGARVLEIGCGAGMFLVEIADRGWDVTALDMSEEAISHVRNAGFKGVVGTLEQAKFPSGHFDAVFAWMLVEHLVDPLAGLREIARILKPGAHFAFSVPNADGGFEFWRDRWFSLMVPTHVHHFTKRTLGDVLRRGGFAPVRFIQQRTLLTQLSQVGLGAWADKNVRLARAITHPLACVVAAMSKSDALTVLARRR